MLVVNKFPHSITNESFRALRTSIKYASVDKELKTIAITSALDGEGKSSVAANLALSLSEDEKNVLLVDCNLRNPKLHDMFQVGTAMGLTNLLANECKRDSVTHKINKRLDFLSAGKITNNAPELLGSKNMDMFLEDIKSQYDYIILDTPSVMSVTDPQILAAKVDGTIIVVKANKSKNAMVVKAYKELEKVKATVIGTVLNGSNRLDKFKTKNR